MFSKGSVMLLDGANSRRKASNARSLSGGKPFCCGKRSTGIWVVLGPRKSSTIPANTPPGFSSLRPHLPASPYPPQRRITRINSLLAQDFLVMRHWMDHGTCSTAPVDQGKTTVYHDFSRRSHGAHAALGGRQIQRVDHLRIPSRYRWTHSGRHDPADTMKKGMFRSDLLPVAPLLRG
jgi:hypothetical protein